MKGLLASASAAAFAVVEVSRVEVSPVRFGGWVGVFVVKFFSPRLHETWGGGGAYKIT